MARKLQSVILVERFIFHRGSCRSRLARSLVHQFDWMTNAQLHACESRAGADVHLAAGIAGREYCALRFPARGPTSPSARVRHLRLQEVIDSSRAATSFRALSGTNFRQRPCAAFFPMRHRARWPYKR